MKAPRSVLLALALAACSDPSGPSDGRTRPITVNLCSALAPGVWFAYRNEGGEWTQVTPNGTGTIVFAATERVSVASAISFFGLTFTEIVNTTGSELEGASAVSCDGDFGSRSMSGTVTGLGAEEFARVSAASSIDGATQVDPNWMLDDLPDHPIDLVAARYPTSSSQPAERVLVRRGVTPNGAVSPLDFSSAESAALEGATATFTGVPTNGLLTIVNSLLTATGTNVELGELSTGPVDESTQAVNYVSLPASLRIASDMHVISASASTAEATQTIVHYYQAPSAKTLAFGPPVSEPTLTNATTSPIVRPRVQVAAPSAYRSALVIELGETSGDDTRYVSILTTAGFLGGPPQAWDVTVPDMSSAGYDEAWGLATTTYNWSVTAYGTPDPVWPFGVQPADGTTIVSSTRGKIEIIARPRLARVFGSLSPFSRGRLPLAHGLAR
jgi:hypothetical protein